MANGGLEQLFNLSTDPDEIQDQSKINPEVCGSLRAMAITDLSSACGTEDAVHSNELAIFTPSSRPLERIYQFDRSRGIKKFPEHPRDCL